MIIDNLKNGRGEKTVPGTLPVICNMSNIPIVGTPFKHLEDYPLVHKGRRYHFGSEVDRWIFEQEPERYEGHLSIVDRFLAGKIDPPDLGGVLAYMGIGVLSPGGDDAHNYAWVDQYRETPQVAS